MARLEDEAPTLLRSLTELTTGGYFPEPSRRTRDAELRLQPLRTVYQRVVQLRIPLVVEGDA